MLDEKTIVARNVVLLSGTEVACKALDLVLAFIIANKLGSESFGLLNYAYGVGATVALLPNFGLDVLTVRDVAADHTVAPRYLANGAAVKCLLSPVALGAAVVFALVTGRGAEATLILALGTLIVLSDGFLRFVHAFFRAHQTMQYETLVRAMLSIVNVGTGLAVLYAGGKLVELLAVRLAVYTLGVCGAILLLQTRRLFRIALRPQLSAMWALAKSAAPFALLVAFTVIFISIDVVMVGLIKGDSEVGIYAAARRLTFVVLLVAGGFTESVLPAMTRRMRAPNGSVEGLLRVSTRLLLVMALPVVGCFTWYANAWVALVFNATYARSGLVLAILSCALLFDFMNHAGNRALLACKAEKRALWIVGGAALFNIVTNGMLIPRYGAPGAALTTVATEVIVFGAQTIALARRGARLALRDFIRPLLAFLVMAVLLWALTGRGVPWYVGAPAACLAYVAALLALGTFSRDEIAFFFRLLRCPRAFLLTT